MQKQQPNNINRKQTTKMKTMKILVAMAILLAGFTAKGQDYQSDMDTLVKQINSPAPNYALLATQFQNMAQANPDTWEASYYFVYCTTMQAFGEKGEKIDQLLDTAEPVILTLKKKNPTESEFYVLEAMVNMARIAVSPMARGMKYSQKYNELLEKALALNPENPRALLIKGMGVLNMPAMFGGGKDKAKPLFVSAKEKFEKASVPTALYPSWGKYWNLKMVAVCEK